MIPAFVSSGRLLPACARPSPRRARLPYLRFAGATVVMAVVLATLGPTPSSAQTPVPARDVHRHSRRRHAASSPATASPARVCPNADTPVRDASPQVMDAAVLCLINLARREHGLPRLHNRAQLDRSAQQWTNWMVGTGEYTHGTDFAARIEASGYPLGAAGEDIDTGARTPNAVVNAFMGSAPHCENILRPMFRDIGVGVSAQPIRGYALSGGTWTLDFGLSMLQTPPSDNYGPAEGCPY